jgi:hypothetical protein
MPESKTSFLKRIFMTSAVVFLNMAILFILLELLLGAVLYARDKIRTRIVSLPVYHKVLDLEYAPWVQFKSVNHSSAHTNVDGLIRKSLPDTCANVKDDDKDVGNIYFFGGSTMFGANVADSETIPSHFATIYGKANKNARIRVWNYGNPYYYSTQEMFLLFSLIAQGRRPSAVVFLDGLNDVLQQGSSYHRYPFYTPSLKKMFRSGEPSASYLLSALFQKSNIYRALTYLRRMKGGRPDRITDRSYEPPPGVSEDECARVLVDNYLDMIRATKVMCEAYGIKCYFFWQPVPYCGYDRTNDLLCDKRSFPIFQKIFPVIKKESVGIEGLYYLGDMLEGYKGAPFIDIYHYSSAVNEMIAYEMAQRVYVQDGSNHD